MDDDHEVRLYIDDHDRLDGQLVFVGSLIQALKMCWRLVPSARSYARMVTPDRTYDAAQIEDMRREDEGAI